MKLEFFTYFLNAQIQNFKKICPMGPKLFHSDVRDEWTDMTKLTVVFHNSTNVPKTE
jgi:hypothetical protein